jgi:hypothetical protein
MFRETKYAKGHFKFHKINHDDNWNEMIILRRFRNSLTVYSNNHQPVPISISIPSRCECDFENVIGNSELEMAPRKKMKIVFYARIIIKPICKFLLRSNHLENCEAITHMPTLRVTFSDFILSYVKSTIFSFSSLFYF